jgi:predicted DNA-binding protein
MTRFRLPEEMVRKKKPEVVIVSIRLPVDVKQYLDEVAKKSKLTVSHMITEVVKDYVEYLKKKT